MLTKQKMKFGRVAGFLLFVFLMFFSLKVSSTNSGIDVKVTGNELKAEYASPCHFLLVEINEFVYCSTTPGNCCGVVVVTG